MDLIARAEVGHLARELHVDEEDLDFLVAHDPGAVRRLRAEVARALADEHRATFAAMARAARLLPTAVLPPIAERIVGPVLCGKITAELDPAHARRIVGHFSVGFLADLCGSVDAHAAADVLSAIPARPALEVGRELHRRGEIDTLAKFVDVVVEPAIAPMLEVLDDAELLRIAVVAESRLRLSAIFSTIDDDRILGLVEAAVVGDVLADCLVVVAELEPDQLARTVAVVVDGGDRLVTDVVAAIADLSAWDQLLPVIAALDPEHVARVAASPVLTRPDVIAGVADHVVAAGAVDDFVALVGAVPASRQQELAAAIADAGPDLGRSLLALAAEHGVDADLPALAALRDRLA